MYSLLHPKVKEGYLVTHEYDVGITLKLFHLSAVSLSVFILVTDLLLDMLARTWIRKHTDFTRAKRASLTRPWRLSAVSLSFFILVTDLLFDCSRVLEYANIRTVLQSSEHAVLTLPRWGNHARSQELHKGIIRFFSDCGRISSVGRLLDCLAGGHVFNFRGRTWILSVLTFTWLWWMNT